MVDFNIKEFYKDREQLEVKLNSYDDVLYFDSKSCLCVGELHDVVNVPVSQTDLDDTTDSPVTLYGILPRGKHQLEYYQLEDLVRIIDKNQI